MKSDDIGNLKLKRKNCRIRCPLKFEEVVEVKSKNKNKSLEYMAIKYSLLPDKNF